MIAVLEWMRTANIYLGVVAVFAAAYRLTPLVWAAVAHRRRTTPPVDVLVALFLYVAVTPLATVQATVLDAPVGPVTLPRFVVHVLLIWVCIRWRDDE